MEKIRFTFDETNEEVVFCVLGSTQVNDIAYILVVEEDKLNDPEPDAYILKAVEADDSDIFYDIVDDEDEIDQVLPALEQFLEDFEID